MNPVIWVILLVAVGVGAAVLYFRAVRLYRVRPENLGPIRQWDIAKQGARTGLILSVGVLVGFAGAVVFRSSGTTQAREVTVNFRSAASGSADRAAVDKTLGDYFTAISAQDLCRFDKSWSRQLRRSGPFDDCRSTVDPGVVVRKITTSPRGTVDVVVAFARRRGVTGGSGRIVTTCDEWAGSFQLRPEDGQLRIGAAPQLRPTGHTC